MDAAQWVVYVLDDATGGVVHRVLCSSERAAERVEDGININLNHERYSTRVAQEAAPKVSA